MATGDFYPYVFLGIFGGPLVLLLGIIGWVKNYRQKHNRFPNPISSFNRTSDKYKGFFRWHMAMFDYLFSHVLQFWTIWVVLWIVMVFLLMPFFKNSTAYKIATAYAEKDPVLKEKIGKIKYYGFLVGGSVSSLGTGDLSFSIIGENGIVSVNAIVENIDGQSKVTSIKYR